MFTYNLSSIPFSMAGSFLVLTPRNTSGTHRLLYRTSSQRLVRAGWLQDAPENFFELALIRDGAEVPYTCIAEPHRLDLQAEGGGTMTLAFANPTTLTFETQGLHLRLVPCKSFATVYQPSPDHVSLGDWAGHGAHSMRAGEGTVLQLTRLEADGHRYDFNGRPVQIDFVGQRGALRFQMYEDFWQSPFPSLEAALEARQVEYARWAERIPATPEVYRATAETAWFLLWNSQVPAEGKLTRPAIFMSKSWMNSIWSWDNCFNALAVAKADPELAWNQLLLFFDYQDPNGCLPDSIHDLDVLFGFNKPPIQGWTIQKLVERIGLEKSRSALKEIYKPLGRFTEWWYTYRDYDDDGMCQYHHGNDSGWDNATLFDQGYPTESADLAAHLVLQCEGLEFIAQTLGKKVAALRWKTRAKVQLKNLIRHSVRDNRFFSPLSGQDEAPETQSLLNSIPIVLGKRLPKRIRQTLVADLGFDGPYLTEWGLATEAPASPKYNPNGYWRGPIWAPSTYLIFDGLRAAGEKKLARAVAERFCNLCAQDAGFWENYDALTGQGLCCPGYTWTASVFLLLAETLNG